jgi:hypothetical protein
MSDKVHVKALRFHTLFGEAHEPGATYEVDAAYVDNLIGQGMVERTDAPPAKPAKK